MRIAVCLSGQGRTFSEPQPDSRGSQFPPSVPNIIENLIIPTGADVFCHFWNTTGPGLDPWGLCRKLKPKECLVEEQIVFDNGLWESRWKDEPEEFGYDISEKRYQTVHSMYHSIYQANLLKSLYESENNFKYDCVIRSRVDLAFDRVFTLDEFLGAPEAIWLCNKEERPSGMSYADLFAFSTSERMDYYSECIHNLPDILREGTSLLAENILHDHLKNEEVKISNYSYSVVREPR